MGPNLGRERSGNNTPTTSSRRLFGINATLAAGGLAALPTGEVIRRVFPVGTVRAEVRRAPTLQELVDSSPAVETLTGQDEKGQPRSFRFRMHPKSPLALGLSPRKSEEDRQVFADLAAAAASRGNLPSADFLMTSSEMTPFGMQMEPLSYPGKEGPISLGHIGSGNLDGVATVVYAPTPAPEAEKSLADESPRGGLYFLLERAFAGTIVSGGGQSTNQVDSRLDALREKLQGMFMITPRAKAEENPTGDRLRDLAIATPETSSVSRLVFRSQTGLPWEALINPDHQEALPWWLASKMNNRQLEGNLNMVGLTNPNKGNLSNIVVEGLPMGAASSRTGWAELYMYYDHLNASSGSRPDIFWTLPQGAPLDNSEYAVGLNGALTTGLYSLVVDGQNAGKTYSPAETQAFADFYRKFPGLFIIRARQ